MGRFSLAEFFAPLPLAAVALLAINDRFLKPRFHNAITGKLSDLALCFFLPLLLSSLLGIAWRRHPRARVLVGAAITVVAFTAQEIWPPFQACFIEANLLVGSPFGIRKVVLTTDLTDLGTLAVLPLAVVYGWKRLAVRPPRQ
jgi:hypothetical protein